MKVYGTNDFIMTSGLYRALEEIRRMRAFNVEEYVKAKVLLIGEYCQKTGLDTAIVGVSGGIDSAVVYCLLKKVQEAGRLKQVIPVSLPVHGMGATKQGEAIIRARALTNKWGDVLHVFDVVKPVYQIVKQVEHNFDKTDEWAIGQLAAYARSPYLYYLTSVFSAKGFKPFVAGTTNRDEGAYLGYVGKASDGMVDVQLISDLHKSEVFRLANYCGVPSQIMEVVPSGDMYDGRVDEEVFGTTYDFVEIYLNWLNGSEWFKKRIEDGWSDDDFKNFMIGQKNMEALHHYNRHKYWVGSPAIHLDIQESAVKDGWQEGVHSGLFKRSGVEIINTGRFVGFIDNPPQLFDAVSITMEKVAKDVLKFNGLLSLNEVSSILRWKDDNWEKSRKTNEYGFLGNGSRGSSRLSFFSFDFARIVFERLKLSGNFPDLFFFNDLDTNWHESRVWRALGVNPMFRIMQYEEGDFLVPHYDDSFYKNDVQRSLLTLVVSLEVADSGGATRFLRDQQKNTAFEKRNFYDWDRMPNEDEIDFSINHSGGSAVVFPHRLLHDGETVLSGRKVILRSEIMFEMCSVQKMGS